METRQFDLARLAPHVVAHIVSFLQSDDKLSFYIAYPQLTDICVGRLDVHELSSPLLERYFSSGSAFLYLKYLNLSNNPDITSALLKFCIGKCVNLKVLNIVGCFMPITALCEGIEKLTLQELHFTFYSDYEECLPCLSETACSQLSSIYVELSAIRGAVITCFNDIELINTTLHSFLKNCISLKRFHIHDELKVSTSYYDADKVEHDDEDEHGLVTFPELVDFIVSFGCEISSSSSELEGISIFHRHILEFWSRFVLPTDSLDTVLELGQIFPTYPAVHFHRAKLTNLLIFDEYNSLLPCEPNNLCEQKDVFITDNTLVTDDLFISEHVKSMSISCCYFPVHLENVFETVNNLVPKNIVELNLSVVHCGDFAFSLWEFVGSLPQLKALSLPVCSLQTESVSLPGFFNPSVRDILIMHNTCLGCRNAAGSDKLPHFPLKMSNFENLQSVTILGIPDFGQWVDYFREATSLRYVRIVDCDQHPSPVDICDASNFVAILDACPQLSGVVFRCFCLRVVLQCDVFQALGSCARLRIACMSFKTMPKVNNGDVEAMLKAKPELVAHIHAHVARGSYDRRPRRATIFDEPLCDDLRHRCLDFVTDDVPVSSVQFYRGRDFCEIRDRVGKTKIFCGD